jgi:hypothetical protein
MVIAVIDQDHIATVESKSHSPVPTHLNRPLTCKLAFESMKPPRGRFYVARTLSGIERSKLKTQPCSMRGLDTGFRAGAEETLQAGVSKALDHMQSVSLHATGCKERL